MADELDVPDENEDRITRDAGLRYHDESDKSKKACLLGYIIWKENSEVKLTEKQYSQGFSSKCTP